ncbi:MAG: Mpo1-like protein, partial [Candidatus Acidiferrales bacterium]
MSIADYMSRYEHEHTSPWNRLLHAIGIPLIFAGLILLALLQW